MRPALPPEVEQTRKGCTTLLAATAKQAVPAGAFSRKSRLWDQFRNLALGTGQILADFWAVQMKFPRHLTSPH
jgi:hypothetical protein